MIRFEVTGETPEQFARNAIEAWGVLATGLQQLAAHTLAAVNGAPTAPASPEPAAASPVSATATTGMMPSSTSSASAKPATIKPDQIKDRLAEVVLAHGTVAGRDLLSKVNARKVTDIDTDERRAEFMRASEEYLLPGDIAGLDDAMPF